MSVAAWRNLPANMAKGCKFERNNSFMRFCRYYMWHYCWSGRQYGLQYHDWAFEPDPEVKEALRRLRLKDPYQAQFSGGRGGYDLRLQRLVMATQLSQTHERLPKDMWTKWDDETFYLKPFFDEIEAEKLERDASTGVKPGFLLKEQA
uniref:Cytochrome b-c1 complex subunit 7 n=1 Tax=Globodera pallida TaxID=36090 RepID=A0A183BJJ9_GLOPA